MAVAVAPVHTCSPYFKVQELLELLFETRKRGVYGLFNFDMVVFCNSSNGCSNSYVFSVSSLSVGVTGAVVCGATSVVLVVPLFF